MMKSSFPKSETCERREKTFQKILKWQLPQNPLRFLNSWCQMLWDMHLLLSTVVLLTVLNVRVDNLWGNIATKTLSDHHLSFYLPNVMQCIMNVEIIFWNSFARTAFRYHARNKLLSKGGRGLSKREQSVT